MSMTVYKWMIIYSDNSTEIVQSNNIVDAIEEADGEWYTKGVNLTWNEWVKISEEFRRKVR